MHGTYKVTLGDVIAFIKSLVNRDYLLGLRRHTCECLNTLGGGFYPCAVAGATVNQLDSNDAGGFVSDCKDPTVLTAVKVALSEQLSALGVPESLQDRPPSPLAANKLMRHPEKPAAEQNTAADLVPPPPAPAVVAASCPVACDVPPPPLPPHVPGEPHANHPDHAETAEPDFSKFPPDLADKMRAERARKQQSHPETKK